MRHTLEVQSRAMQHTIETQGRQVSRLAWGPRCPYSQSDEMEIVIFFYFTGFNFNIFQQIFTIKFRILRLHSVVLRQSSPSAKPQGNLTVNLKKVKDFKKELAPFGKSQDMHSWFVYDSFIWICLPKTSISKSCFKVLEWFARLADASQMGRSCSLWSWSRSYHSECLKRRKADYVRGELGAFWNATVLLPVVSCQHSILFIEILSAFHFDFDIRYSICIQWTGCWSQVWD